MVDTIVLDKQASSAATVDAAFRSEKKRLFDFIRRRVRSEADAEDILSDVFFQLVSTYDIAAPIERMTSWLFTVARNKIIDWYRKRKPDQSLQRDAESLLPLNLEEILYDPDQNPDDLYARSLVWTELSEALDELPDDQKEVFVMHELEGKSFKEIAQKTGEPLNTLLSRKRYAVLFLREKLQELYEDFNTL